MVHVGPLASRSGWVHVFKNGQWSASNSAIVNRDLPCIECKEIQRSGVVVTYGMGSTRGYICAKCRPLHSEYQTVKVEGCSGCRSDLLEELEEAWSPSKTYVWEGCSWDLPLEMVSWDRSRRVRITIEPLDVLEQGALPTDQLS